MIRKSQMAFDDIIYAMVYIFGAALFIFLLFFIFGQIKQPISSALSGSISDSNSTVNIAEIQAGTSSTLKMFSNLFPLIIIGLILMVLVSAAFIDSHPVFFAVGIILLLITIVVGGVFSNVYKNISSDTNFGNTASELSLLGVIMKYLPAIVAVIIIAAFIIMFGRPGGGATRGL